MSGDGNLCFFRCLACFEKDRRRCEIAAKQLFEQYAARFGGESFEGITLADIPFLEDLYEINIVIYKLEEKVAKLVQRSRGIYDRTMKLNLYNKHLSLITDFERYCHVFKCGKCSKLFYNRHNNCLQHVRNCNVKVKEIFKGGVYRIVSLYSKD